ncbi:MAG: hypothetical protein ACN6OP_08180, partial [Pseudomonadales bacterium]
MRRVETFYSEPHFKQRYQDPAIANCGFQDGAITPSQTLPIEFQIPEGMTDGFIQMIDPGSEFSVRVLHVYPSVPKQAAYLTSEMSMFI